MIKGQEVTLTGEQALTYIRSRKGMEFNTNENRMGRQRQFISAARAQLAAQNESNTPEQNEKFIIEASTTLDKYMVSDCTLAQLQDLYRKVSTYEYKGIIEIEGKPVTGVDYMEFHPDKAFVNKLVVDVFYVPKE